MQSALPEELWYNEYVFLEAIPPYQNALNRAGYEFKMKYEARKESGSKKKNRKRHVIWFTPPWSVNCKDKVGAKFLKLVDTCFPPSHPLHKIFNRNTLKVSYSCMPNMAQEISKHNHKVKNQTQPREPQGCNCRGGHWPLPTQWHLPHRGPGLWGKSYQRKWPINRILHWPQCQKF